MTYTYKTKGTCSTNIELEVEDGIVRNIAFWGGCNGNLQGLSRLVAGDAGERGDFTSGRYPLRRASHFLSRPVV